MKFTYCRRTCRTRHSVPPAAWESWLSGARSYMLLKTVQDGRMVDVPILAGEIYILPAHVPHSPQRPAGSVGIVVERRRAPHELDGFSWYCENCGHRLFLERVA